MPKWARKTLEGCEREYLLAVDEEEYVDHLVRQAEWEPFVWHEERRDFEPLTENLTPHGRPRGILRIPCDPHPARQTSSGSRCTEGGCS